MRWVSWDSPTSLEKWPKSHKINKSSWHFCYFKVMFASFGEAMDTILRGNGNIGSHTFCVVNSCCSITIQWEKCIYYSSAFIIRNNDPKLLPPPPSPLTPLLLFTQIALSWDFNRWRLSDTELEIKNIRYNMLEISYLTSC